MWQLEQHHERDQDVSKLKLYGKTFTAKVFEGCKVYKNTFCVFFVFSILGLDLDG